MSNVTPMRPRQPSTKEKAPSGKLPVKRHASGRGIVRVSPATADMLDNPASIEEWDDEELQRGRRKDKNGRFTGRDPVVIPTECYREFLRRQHSKARMKMVENVEEAVDALVNIVNSTKAEDSDIIKAASLIMDRVLGKVTDKVEIENKQPLFIGLLQGGIVPGSLTKDDPSIIDTEATDITWD